MSFITDLMAKGVSRAGAVQVLLGQPISLAADRFALTRLAIPIARESLTQAPSAPSLTRVSDPRITQIVSAVDGTTSPTGSSYLDSVIVQTQTSTASTNPQQAKIDSLNASIRNTELAIQKLIQQLLKLAVPPPGVPFAVWQAQVKMLRNMLQNLRNVLASLMQQRDALTSTSSSSRGSESITSLNQTQGRMSDLTSDGGKGSTGTSGSGA
jgi:hypothetical protein